MTEPIKPALTAEEWASAMEYGVAGWIETMLPREAEPNWDGIAALALSQGSGFTREDGELLRWLLRNSRDQTDIVIDDWLDEEQTARLRSLAVRIESLLPPEKP